ncbi:hypothetical protein [Hydrocarboniphaga sp.]|uniref:hypothetical protein n=1 Tax=Hydrocarboniphaga sp. TaxID=2033016 RepID=UPI003D0D8B66
MTHATLSRTHDQRLRAMYRSAGWPCLDAIEIDLLAAGLLERVCHPAGPENLRVTDAGLQHLSTTLNRNRAALDAHEALVERVCEEQSRNGRIAYRGLTLLAKPDVSWLHLRPDVFSICNTTVEDYVEPIVFEVKVKRADLKADLKKAEKRAGYLAMSSQCYYVLAEGVGDADDVPPECGVMIASGDSIRMLRVAPKRPMKIGFGSWMALAKADRYRSLVDPAPLL